VEVALRFLAFKNLIFKNLKIVLERQPKFCQLCKNMYVEFLKEIEHDHFVFYKKAK